MKLLSDISVDIETALPAADPNLGKLVDESTYNLPQLIRVGIQFLLVAVAVSSFIFLLYGALQWVMAGGDKEGIEKARKKITNAIIGLAITLSVFAIMRLVQVVFGIDIIGNIDIPTL